jgi:hypothetical protein
VFDLEPFHNNPVFKPCVNCKSQRICSSKEKCLLKASQEFSEKYSSLSILFGAKKKDKPLTPAQQKVRAQVDAGKQADKLDPYRTARYEGDRVESDTRLANERKKLQDLHDKKAVMEKKRRQKNKALLRKVDKDGNPVYRKRPMGTAESTTSTTTINREGGKPVYGRKQTTKKAGTIFVDPSDRILDDMTAPKRPLKPRPKEWTGKIKPGVQRKAHEKTSPVHEEIKKEKGKIINQTQGEVEKATVVARTKDGKKITKKGARADMKPAGNTEVLTTKRGKIDPPKTKTPVLSEKAILTQMPDKVPLSALPKETQEKLIEEYAKRHKLNKRGAKTVLAKRRFGKTLLGALGKLRSKL